MDMARATKSNKPPHRPQFAWTPEIEEEILTQIMRGESIATICGNDRDDFIPSEVTFYKHLASDDDFAKRYTRAREVQGHREFDEILQIAAEAKPDTVGVAKLQIDARKWRAGKLAPKVYGDKQPPRTNRSGGRSCGGQDTCRLLRRYPAQA